MKVEIKSLVVKNCGPLRDVEISFMDGDKPRPITLIAGANGSGKTTVLELIVLLAQPILSILEPPQPLRPEIWAELHLLMDGYDVCVEAANGNLKVIHDKELSTVRPSILKADEKRLPIDEVANLASVLYFPYYRRILRNRGEQMQRESAVYQWIYRYEAVDTFAGSLNSYFVWLDYAEPELFEQMRQFVNDVVLTDGKHISEVVRKELRTMIELPDGTKHPLEQLSSGEQNLLIILLELRRRLTPGSIVLIDEIENSLHPAFQHRLGNALKKLQQQIPFQLIVTTHARAFLDVFGRKNTLILTEF